MITAAAAATKSDSVFKSPTITTKSEETHNISLSLLVANSPDL